MATRRTNLALLVVVPVAFATGAFAFAVGTGWARWAAVAHGIAGLAVVVLSPYKSVIIRRGMGRRRRWRWSSVAFGVVMIAIVATGLMHSTGLAVDLGPVTAMQVHVGAALAAIPFLALHLVTRPEPVRRTDLSRRQLIRVSGLVGGSALALGAVEGTVRLTGLAGADRRFTGSHERGSFRPDAMPVTQWLDDGVAHIEPSDCALVVSGAGGERAWTYDELSRFEDEVEATLDCTGGWWATQRWQGVWLSRLVDSQPGGRSVAVRSVTGYGRRFPRADAGRLVVATRVGGRRLSAGHGFPARIVAPGRRGFWWVKWVERVEVSETPWWLQSPFPLT